MTTPIRLFVSSPSDVAAERQAVERVARRVEGLFDGVKIEVYRWEKDHYYSAHTGFQEQIAEIGGFDLVVGVLWSRLGSPLPPGFAARMPPPREGEPYPSGTAFELLEAIRLRRERDHAPPDIFVYRKLAPANFAAADDDVGQAKLLAELQEVNRFMSDFFVNGQEGFKAAFKTFQTVDAFEVALEADLSAWLKASHRLGTLRVWRIEERGAPFVGLHAFDVTHREVFFGRRSEIERAREYLEAGQGFLLIDGASGTGKSSLARAGLLPRLTDLDPLVRVAITVPETETPLFALVQALFHPGALPDLALGDYPQPAALTQHFVAGGDAAPILRALDRAADRLMTELHLDTRPMATLVLLVDQLEGLFASRIKHEEQTAYARLLEQLVASGRVRVIATLRANAREVALAIPSIGRLINANRGLALEPPAPDALGEIMRAPAVASGITYERNEDGIGLDEVLLAEVTSDSAALPLLQFALERLYQLASEKVRSSGQRLGEAPAGSPVLTLTHADYISVGGMSGAIEHQAETAMRGLSEASKGRLPALVRALTEGGGGTLMLGRAAIDQVAPDTDTRALVDALVNARILVQGRISDQGDGPDRASLRFSHERVLTAWSRARDAAQSAATYLRIRTELLRAEARWRTEGKTADLLLPKGVRLAEAERILKEFGPELDLTTPQLRHYVAASRRRRSLTLSLTRAAAFTFFSISVAALWLFWEANRQRTYAEQRQNNAIFSLANAMAYYDANESLKLVLSAFVTRAGISKSDAIRGLSAIRVATKQLAPQRQLPTTTLTVTAIAISEDSNLLATGSSDGSIQVWNLGDPVRPIAQMDGSRKEISAIAFSLDGDRILFGDIEGNVGVWKADASGDPEVLYRSSSAAERIIVDGETGRYIIIDADFAHILDAESEFSLVRNIDLIGGKVIDAWITADLNGITFLFYDGLLTTWDLISGLSTEDMRASLDGNGVGVAVPNESELIIASKEGGFSVTDIDGSREEPAQFETDSGEIDAVTLSSDQKHLYSISSRNSVRVWKVSDWVETREFNISHGFRIKALAVTKSEEYLVALSHDGKVLILELTRTKRDLNSLGTPVEYASRILLSPDSRLLAIAGFEDLTVMDRSSFDILWRARSNWTTYPETGWIHDISFSPDGSLIAAGNESGLILVINSATGKVMHEVRTGKNQPIWDLTFSPDGRQLMIAAGNAGVLVWDATSAQLSTLLPQDDDNDFTAVTPFKDGKRLLVGRDGSVHIVDMEKGSIIDGETREYESAIHEIYLSHDETHSVIHVEGGISILQIADFGFSSSGSFWTLEKGENSVLPPLDGLPIIARTVDGGWITIETSYGMPFGTPILDPSVEMATMASDGKTIAAIDKDGSLSVWSSDELVGIFETACRALPRIGEVLVPLSEESAYALGASGAVLPSDCKGISPDFAWRSDQN